MANPTPGPWLVRKRDEKFKLPNGQEVSNQFAYEVYSGEPELINVVCRLGLVSAGPDTVEANARLIAVAPDLYKLLCEAKRLMDIARDRCDGDLFGKEHNNAVDWDYEVDQLFKRVQP